MDPNSDSRIDNNDYNGNDYLVPVVTAVSFFGANYIYHKNVFRANQNKLQFTAFLLVNLFTSTQVA